LLPKILSAELKRNEFVKVMCFSASVRQLCSSISRNVLCKERIREIRRSPALAKFRKSWRVSLAYLLPKKEPFHWYSGGVPKQQGLVLKMHVGITRNEAKDLQIQKVGRIKHFPA